MAEHALGPKHQSRVKHAATHELDNSRKNGKSIVQIRDFKPSGPSNIRGSDPPISIPQTPMAHASSIQTIAPPLISLSPGEQTETSDVPSYDFFEDLTYASIQDSGVASDGAVDSDGKWLPCGPFSSATLLNQRPAHSSGPNTSKNTRPNPYNDTSHSPYDNRAICLTHTLFNTPSIRFSEAQQLAVLDWARELGAEDVPSMYALRKCDQKLAALMGDITRKFTTRQGDVYYVNDIGAMLKQDFSNPDVREHLEFYPRESDGHVSEIWHGEKMLSGDNQAQLSPMASHHGQSYFVDEIAQLSDGSYFVANMFIKRHGELYARGYRFSPQTALGPDHFVYGSEPCVEPLSDFRKTCIQLAASHPNGIVVSGGPVAHSNDISFKNWLGPHRLRELAAGREVYSIPFVVFIDDVSGNTSKQWNKHWCCYISNAALPRSKMNQRSNIRFMSTTQHVDPIEMLNGICEMFEETFDKPVVVWDTASSQEVLVRPYIHVISGDNPMQAMECSTCGLLSNLLCRTCRAGGTRKFKRSSKGLAALMETGTLRTQQYTISAIDRQYDIAFTPNPSNRLVIAQRESGVKDSITQGVFERIIEHRQELKENTTMAEGTIAQQLRSKFKGESEGPARMNPLLSLRGFDVHLDTPTETLHTILLGVVKYLWIESIQQMDKNDAFTLFSTRLRSISVSGLNCGPVPTYIINNRGSLNGKHFKLLVQTASFCLHDLVPVNLIQAWTVLGRLAVLAWYPSIDDLDQYEQELKESIEDFLYTVAKFIPALIVQKAKLHLIVHMPLFVRRFGPLLGPSSERYESFNSTFRAASVHSNRQAPSRDIAKSFALFDMVKHIMSGGTWYDNQTQCYTRAGSSIIELCESSSLINRLLGGRKKLNIPGTVNISAASKSAFWVDFAPPGLALPANLSIPSNIWPALSICAQNGDTITPGSNVIFQLDELSPMIGRIQTILADSQQNAGIIVVILQLYNWVELDDTLHMPAVRLMNDFKVIPGSAISCEINLQHRCAHVGCMDTSSVPIFQEREQTGTTRAAITHNDNINFVVNTFSFHNCLALKKLINNRFGCYNRRVAPSQFTTIQKDGAAMLRNNMKRGNNTEQDSDGSDHEETLSQQTRIVSQGPKSSSTHQEHTHTHIGHQSTRPTKAPGASSKRKRKRSETTNSISGHPGNCIPMPDLHESGHDNAYELSAPFVPPTMFG